jgi:tetratricopeptide (TPR) repeat protein
MQTTIAVMLLAAVLLSSALGVAIASPAETHAGERGQAVETARRALDTATNAFGRHDPRTLQAASALVSAYLDVGDQAAAAPLARDLLVALEHAVPRNESAIALVTGDLAQIAQLDGRMDEAEKLYRRSLELAEKARGENHTDTAHALNNLGVFLKDTDRPHEAEPLMRRAVRIRERSLGPSNSLTGQSLCTLGVIAALQEDMLVAEALLRQSLAVRLAATPPASRADVAESQLALTRLLLTIGEVTEAQKLAAAAVDNYRASFGPHHLQTLMAMHAKAEAISATGWGAESDRLHRELVTAIEQFKPQQPDLLADALGDYGRHLVLSGQVTRGLELHRRAVALRQRQHGDHDRVTVKLRRYLAESLYLNGEAAAAVEEAHRIVAVLERDAPQSLDTGASLVSLAKYLLATGDTNAARGSLRRAVTILEKTSGRAGAPTLQALSLLATSHFAGDELAEAEKVVEDAMSRYRAEPDIRSTAAIGEIIRIHGMIMRRTGRLKEAEQAAAVVRQIEDDGRR